jgi:hypothetical protein
MQARTTILRPFPLSPRFIFLVLIPVLCLPLDSAAGKRVELKLLLPGVGDATGWKSAGEPQEYAGEDLYAYIDGGAEIYQEYGFVRVIVQDYKNPSGKSITLEIYEMKDPGAAYGMYSFKKSASGQDLEWEPESEAQLSDYYLNLWKGRYLATLTGFGEDANTRDGLIGLGRAVGAKIRETAAKPSVVTLLPDPGGTKAGIKYFKGNLGMFNIYAFAPASVFGVEEGVKGDYENGGQIIILKYIGPEKSRARFEAAGKGFAKNPKYSRFRLLADDLFSMKDDAGRTVTVFRLGEYLSIAVGMETSAAKSYFSAIEMKTGRS